ncbi:MAG: hypothetical protein HY859_16410 [Caulobacterales bacterium]|nr:hypothetical protein [Caulobacterales bacterium]
MTGAIARLGAAVAAVALLAGSAAWAGSRPLVELEKDSCAGPVSMVMAAGDGSVVFHHLDAGRYVITLPAETSGVTLAVAEADTGRWIPGRLSGVTGGRRYAICAYCERIFGSVARGGCEIRIPLRGL